jgi:hypothetical protein
MEEMQIILSIILLLSSFSNVCGENTKLLSCAASLGNFVFGN